MPKLEVGDTVKVVPGKHLLTPTELLYRQGVIVKKAYAFDWTVRFSPEEYCPLNECELEKVDGS